MSNVEHEVTTSKMFVFFLQKIHLSNGEHEVKTSKMFVCIFAKDSIVKYRTWGKNVKNDFFAKNSFVK